MSILDKIKGKKSTDPSKEENVLDMVKDPAGKESATPVVLKENTGRAYHVLKSAHVSEKTNSFSHMGRYVFRVNKHTNKLEVKKAVEATYDVHVIKVNIVNTKGKVRRMGRKFGTTEDWKKAIVTLKAGEKIAGLTEGV